MAVLPSIVTETWVDPFTRGSALHDDDAFRLAVDVEADEETRVQILTLDGRTLVLISPEVAGLAGVRGSTSESALRGALAAAGLAMNGADHLFFLSEQQREVLRSGATPSHIRRLGEADEAAFAVFAAVVPEGDFDEASVALDHWVVFGSFHGDALVSVGSAYPFGEESLLADLGVVTLPSHRGQGHGRGVVHALSRHAIAEGFEPQYRCQLDNTSSVMLAGRAGFVGLGTWDAPLPDEDPDVILAHGMR